MKIAGPHHRPAAFCRKSNCGSRVEGYGPAQLPSHHCQVILIHRALVFLFLLGFDLAGER